VENISTGGTMSTFFKDYFAGFNKLVNESIADSKTQNDLLEVVQILKKTKGSKTAIFLVGNGGSAAIAEHMAIDLTKNAGLRALAISGSPMLTTFSNDFGYERVFQKGLESFANQGDILIAISSSGTSKSILNACDEARRKKMAIVTFSAFNGANPLRTKGDYNFWVDSKAFGYVEIVHNLLIHYINDAVIGAVEYMIR
jgi:D-sedoheptulose 7-phosphate isomerase